VVSSAAVADGLVYFGGGKTMYCLKASDGSLVWKKVLCGNPETAGCEADAQDPTVIQVSPVIFEGRVIFGHTTNGTRGYRGRVVALDAKTGALDWVFEVDPVLDPNGQPLVDRNGKVPARNRGCGGVWESGSIDEDAKLVFFGTGDCNADATAPYHEAVLALDTSTGKLQWSYQPRTSDPHKCDYDFGACSNVLDLDGKRFVGAGSKDGTYYVLGSTSGNVAWSKNVVFGGAEGGFIGPAAFDGKRVYGSTAVGELADSPCDPNDPRDTKVQEPSFHAFDARTGNVAWELSKAYGFGATSVADGVVFNGVGAPLHAELRAYKASDGTLLKAFPADGAVNSSAAIVGKAIYFGTGNSFNGEGGAVVAYRLP
jgi:outer membrane protein assembly factor BamB